MQNPDPDFIRTKAALQASEALTAAILETALDAIITINHSGLILAFNPAAERMFGYEKEDAIGRELAEVMVPPDLRERHREGLRRAVQTGDDRIVGRRIEVMAQRRNGELFPAELAITRIATGRGMPRFAGHIRDITNRRRAQEQSLKFQEELTRRVESATRELAASRERFSKAFHASPALMFLQRQMDRRFVDVNEAFCHTFQLSRESLLGRTPDEVNNWPRPDAAETFWQTLAEHGSVRDMELAVRSQKGVHYVLASAERFDLDGEPHLLTVGLDITTRRRAEAELRQALDQEKELSQLKSSFVALVSHEFRTPLGIIMAAADTLDAYFERLPAERRRELLADIHQSVRHMSNLMEEVLLLGKVEAGKLDYRPQPLDLRAWCRRFVDEMLSATNHRCPIRLRSTAGSNEEAAVDEPLLRHILSNLITNAVKYSKSGDQVDFTLQREKRDVVFTVRDRGIGIPKEDRPKLFQAFQRAGNVGEIQGSGLGLTIVKRCVELHGGRLTLESEVDAGTTATVRLPVYRRVSAKAKSRS